MFLILNADKLDAWKCGYRKKILANVYLNKVKKLRERTRLHKKSAVDLWSGVRFTSVDSLLTTCPLSVPLLVV